MAITPPSTWNRLDTTPVGEFRSGATVDVADIQDLAENHNALYGGQGFPIGSGFFGSGWTGNAGTNRDCMTIYIPDCEDDLTIRWWVWAANADTVDAANLVVRIHDPGGPTNYTTSIPASTAPGAYTGTHTFTAAGPWSASVQMNLALGAVYSAELSRAPKSGSSVSDAPKASGFCWFQPTQVATRSPVAVEMLNRQFAAPWQIYSSLTACVGSVLDSPQAPRLGIGDTSVLTGAISSGGDFAPQGWIVATPRYTASHYAVIGGRKITSGDGAVILSAGGKTLASITLSSTTTPTVGNVVTYVVSDAFTLQAGPQPVAISCVGAEVWSCQIFTAGT